MPRIAALADAQLPEASRPMVDAVKSKLGMAPNIIRTLAHAPAALNAYLSMSQALAGGALSAGEREEVALAVAQANGCGYCLSAHSLMAKGAGVAADKQLAARQGEGSPLTALARKVTLTRAQLNDKDVADAHAAGLSDAQIVEVLAQVAFNTLTNYVNHVAATDIDFPVVRV
ncbi:MAG: peroxidase-related enzyme [Burkholderiales bacterium]|nr:peroxidase-related enzyme [Burkholderiales bacterium]